MTYYNDKNVGVVDSHYINSCIHVKIINNVSSKLQIPYSKIFLWSLYNFCVVHVLNQNFEVILILKTDVSNDNK